MAASQTPPAKRANGQGNTAINDDVLYEILLRLPAKPLCRLRAVCRSWRSLLSVPSFIAAHTARQAAPFLVLHRHDGSTLTVHVLDILSGKPVKRIRIESAAARESLNSLQLLRTPHDLALVRLPGMDDGHGLRLRVLDPVTGDDFTLPDAMPDKLKDFASFMVGRLSTGDYKVLCISSCGATFCKVLTLSGNGGDRRWRETGCPPAKVRMLHRDAAAVKEVVYFLLCTVYYPERSKECILAYDLEKEIWLPAALPAPVPSNKQPTHTLSHSLSELGGCLALLYEDGQYGFKELWLLTDPGKAIWSRRCTITVPYRYQGVQGSCLESYFAEILWLLDDGRIIILMSLSGLGFPHSVVCTYDPRTMTYTNVADISDYYLLGGVYTGSLLGPGSLHLLYQGGSVQYTLISSQ